MRALAILVVFACGQGEPNRDKRPNANAEVASFFAALTVGQEQYKIDNGVYLAAAACPSGPPSGRLLDVTSCVAAGQPWKNLNVMLPTKQTSCVYETTVGTGTGTKNPHGFTWESPAQGWYYVIATCDVKGDGAPLSTYFTSSTDATIQKLNEGE